MRFIGTCSSYRFCSLVALLISFEVVTFGLSDEKTTSGGSKFVADCSAGRELGSACSDSPSRRLFFFDQQIGACQPFIYQGCGGNGNRFESAEECKKQCSNASGKHSQWVHAEKCNATHLIPDGKYIECNISSKGTSNCPKGHQCGDHGICCPTKDYVCSLRDDTGTFAEGIDDKPRFAWSDAINTCWRFSYYGAKGNYNNFPNFKSCLAFCGKSHS